MCNFATLFGLWIAYEAAPATLQAKIGHALLLCGAIASILCYMAFALFVMRPMAHKSTPERHDNETGTEEGDADPRELFLEAMHAKDKCQDELTFARLEIERLDNALKNKPDASLKESDPRIEIEFRDESRRLPDTFRPDWIYFIPVNRGATRARFICLDSIRLREHLISFPVHADDLLTTRSDHIKPFLTRNDGKECRDVNMLEAMFLEYSSRNDPKLHELPLTLTATYQDDYKNLFQTTCELAFNPSEYVDMSTFGKKDRKPLLIRKQKAERIAARID